MSASICASICASVNECMCQKKKSAERIKQSVRVCVCVFVHDKRTPLLPMSLAGRKVSAVGSTPVLS